jgi:hypothetical protein
MGNEKARHFFTQNKYLVTFNDILGRVNKRQRRPRWIKYFVTKVTQKGKVFKLFVTPFMVEP